MKQHRWAKLALGGLMLSSLIFLFPVLYGEGYSAINILLNGSSEADWNEVLKNSMFYGNGHLLILFIALVIVTKTFATAAREELHVAWYGRRNGRCDACSTYRYIPYSGDNQWLRPLYATYDCGCKFGYDDKHLRASQHLCHASGT